MFERCLYFNLNVLVRQINRIWEEAFQVYGLSAAHAYVLRAVLQSPGIKIGTLAAQLHLDPSTVTRFVNALEARRLLSRRHLPQDRRASGIHPTPEADQLRRQLEDAGQSLYRRMTATLGEATLDQLVSTARSAREALD